MQELSASKTAPVVRRIASQNFYLAITVAAMLLSGCAVKTAYRFSAKSITRVSYDPKNCAETVDGRFKCKDVVFTVATIEPDKEK